MDRFTLAFSVSNLGPKAFQKLLNKYGSSEKAWNGAELGFKELGIAGLTYNKFDSFRQAFIAEKYIEKLNTAGVEFVGFNDKLYPRILKQLENPPIGLFCKGNKMLLKNKGLKIGVVGTRKITQYGRDVTEMIVSDLVRNGSTIVSGLALGVDGKAHIVTLQNSGTTIAVLACGVDCCTPSENYSLYSEILKQDGLIISEYPLSQPPNKGTFLARNRIVAALSDGLLITEAAEGSGSLVTAQYALEFGKKVFAVPGPITSRMSDGSLYLLKQGARLVTKANDILSEFSVSSSQLSRKRKLKKLNLSKEEMMIVTYLQNEGMTIDEISKATNLPVNKLFVILSKLELSGVIKNTHGIIVLNLLA